MLKLKPCFIVFDGTEGAGKTTLMNELMARMVSDEIPFIRTREPGGTPAGEKIRNVLLDPIIGPTLSVTTNALLFAASYRTSLHTRIIPALKEGKVVVSDRTNVTCFVYQEESEHIESMLKINDDLCCPDIVFIMTTTHPVAMERLRHRDAAEKNWRDNVDETTHEKYRARYDEYVKLYPERSIVLDTSLPVEELLSQVINILETRFGK